MEWMEPRWMEKGDVAHIYNGILTIMWNEIALLVEMWMDLESIIQSEVSQKEKTNIVYEGIYVESRKWYSWAYLQGSNRDADAEKGHVDTAGEEEGGTNGKIEIGIYMLPCVNWIASWESPVKNRELSSACRGGDMCTSIADSLWCTAETNATL